MVPFDWTHSGSRSYAGRDRRWRVTLLAATPSAMALAAMLLAVAPGIGARPALAASTGASANVTVTLTSQDASLRPGRPFHVGLRMRAREGWHTYWKNPGDSGLPTNVDWTLPKGFTAGPIEWPAPARIASGPEVSYGYTGEALLLVLITPPKTLSTDSVTIVGDVRWLECADVCLPGKATLTLTLPVKATDPALGPDSASFARTHSLLPRDATGWRLSATAGPRAISLEFFPPNGIVPRNAYLFVDQPLVVDYVAAQPWGPLGQGFRLTASPAPNATGSPQRLTGILTLEDHARAGSTIAVAVDVPVAMGDPSPFKPASKGASRDLLRGILMAIIFTILTLFLRSLWTKREEPDGPGDPRTNGGNPGV